MSTAKKVQMRTVRLPVTLMVKGESIPPGTPVSLPADEADEYVRRWGEAKAPVPQRGAIRPANDSDVLVAISTAIVGFDTKNDTQFTAGGVPRVRAIEAVLGYDITEEERDAAWAALRKA